MNDKGDEIIEECFKSPVKRYQNKFKESTKSIPFVFDYVWLLHYKCHKINPNCDESYIDFPDWIKSKKTAINLINKKYNKRFQYAVTVALNHDEIKKHPHRITKRKSYINRYNWEGIYFLQKKKIQ